MADLATTTAVVTVTVALARTVEWLAKALLKRGGENGASGQKSVSFWEQRIGRMVEEGVTRALNARSEKMRTVFMEVNEPVYDKLDAMLEKQSQMLAKFNEMFIELVRQRNN